MKAVSRDEFDAVIDAIVKAFELLPVEKRTEHNVSAIFRAAQYTLPQAIARNAFPQEKADA